MAENNRSKTFSEVKDELISQRFDANENNLNSPTVYLAYDNQFGVQPSNTSSYMLPVTIINNENNYLFYNNPIDTDIDQLQNKEPVPQYIVNLDGSSKLPSAISPSINTVLMQGVDRLQEMYNRFPLLNKLIVKRIYTRNLLSIDKAIQELDKLHKIEENKRKNIRLVYKQPKKETPQISRTSGDENLKYLVLSSKPFERMSTNLYKKVVIHDNNVFDCNTNSEPSIIENFIKGRCKAFVSDEIHGIIQEDPKGVVIKNESVTYKIKNDRVTSTPDAGSIFPWRNKFSEEKSLENANNTPVDSSAFLYPLYKDDETELCDLDCDIVKPTGFLNDLCIPDPIENEQENPVKKYEESKEPKFFRTKRLGDLELKKRTYVTKELSQIRSEKKPSISDNYAKKRKKVMEDDLLLKKSSNSTDLYEPDSNKKLSMHPVVRNKYKDMLTSEEKDIFLKFFNQCSINELSIMSGCSLEVAEKICSSAPFLNINDFNIKIKNLNIVSENFIQNCHEILNMRNMFSKLMLKCEKVVSKLEDIIGKQMENNHIELSYDNSEPKNLIFETPQCLNKNLQLKPFQMVGVNWLILLHKEKINGILADESGLGKTVQTIAFLAHLCDQGDRGPHLILVPSSSITNWESELKSWCPEMKIIIYHGSQDERKQIRLKIYEGQNIDFNVLLTTYNISTGTMEDRAMMKRVNFHYGIFDEANMLKNMLSNRYKNLINFKVKRRLLLTGASFQNNLLELVSLLSFVLPDMFLPHTDFLKKIFQISNKKKDEYSSSSFLCDFENENIEQTKNLLKPFYVRRLKEQIISQLSAKTMETVLLPLTAYQQQLYDNIIRDLRENMTDERRVPNFHKITELRKLCNHPLLLRTYYSNDTLLSISMDLLHDKNHETANADTIFEDFSKMNDFQIHMACQHYSHTIGKFCLNDQMFLQSNKFQYLDKLLQNLIANGHRVLIFSQFITMLDMLQAFLKLKNFVYFRYDEQIPVCDRKELIDRFNKDESINIFLYSTKAGYSGVSLIGADTVIIYDMDTNPLTDQQAEDVCHNLGQTKNVHVIKLVSKNTIEEKMLLMCDSKSKFNFAQMKQEGGTDDVLEADDAIEMAVSSTSKCKAKTRKVQFQVAERDSHLVNPVRNVDLDDTSHNDIEMLIKSVLM